jgi:hypothetical protein
LLRRALIESLLLSRLIETRLIRTRLTAPELIRPALRRATLRCKPLLRRTRVLVRPPLLRGVSLLSLRRLRWPLLTGPAAPLRIRLAIPLLVLRRPVLRRTLPLPPLLRRTTLLILLLRISALTLRRTLIPLLLVALLGLRRRATAAARPVLLPIPLLILRRPLALLRLLWRARLLKLLRALLIGLRISLLRALAGCAAATARLVGLPIPLLILRRALLLLRIARGLRRPLTLGRRKALLWGTRIRRRGSRRPALPRSPLRTQRDSPAPRGLRLLSNRWLLLNWLLRLNWPRLSGRPALSTTLLIAAAPTVPAPATLLAAMPTSAVSLLCRLLLRVRRCARPRRHWRRAMIRTATPAARPTRRPLCSRCRLLLNGLGRGARRLLGLIAQRRRARNARRARRCLPRRLPTRTLPTPTSGALASGVLG